MNSTRFICFMIIICFSLASLLSCTQQKEYRMDMDKLTLVIRDLNLVELISENKPVDIKDSLRQLNLNRICSLYQTNIDDIQHDLKLISTDYLLLDSIYGHIISLDTTKKSNSKINSTDK